jgi:hypothetical protein
MVKAKSDHNPDQSPANDNGGHKKHEAGAIVPAPAAGALTSLAALGTALSNVDTSAGAGRSGKPMLQFKSRENSGTWMFGQKHTVIEDGSLWVINPASFRWGYVCFSDAKKPLGERLVPVNQSRPDVTTLPDMGFPWQEQWAVDMKCISGADAGVEVVFKINTIGGDQVVKGLIDTIRDRINGGQHDGKVAPIVQPGRDSYRHAQHGPVGIPVLEVVDWMPLDGPAPAPKPASPPPAEQPRRRRVA